MVSFGTVRRRTSSVMVPMTTRVLAFSGAWEAWPTIREREMGGRLVRDMKRRFRTTRLNFEFVRPVRKNGGFCQYIVLARLTVIELVAWGKRSRVVGTVRRTRG